MASFYENLSNYDPTSNTVSFQNISVSGQVTSTTAFAGSIKISTTNMGNIFDPDLLNLGTGLLTVNGNLVTAGLVNGINLQNLDTSVVKLTGNQTIAGDKTFSGTTTLGTTALGTTTANSIDVAGLVEFNSLSGTGSVAITDILDEDNMASNSATMLATQQSIKAYVDSQVDTADSLSEILAISNTTGGNNIAFGDSNSASDDRLVFGDGTDFQIYHDGSNNKSIIKENNASANLQIQGENINITNSNASKSFIQTFDNQDVALYSNGAIKLRTVDGTGSEAAGVNVVGTVTADGLTVDGNTVIDGNVDIKDGHDLTFQHADGSDHLKIFTDSNGHSRIVETGTEDTHHLWVTADRFIVTDNGGASSDYYRIIVGDSDGVKLYADDEQAGSANAAKRLMTRPEGVDLVTGNDGAEVNTVEVRSTGINVTGTVTADGLTLGDNEAATFNGNLEIKSNGTDSSITETGDGALTIKGQNFVVKNSSNQNLIVGASSLQLYGGGVRKAQTVSTGLAVEGTNGGGIVFREKDYDSTDANLDDTLSLKPTDDNWTGHKAITLPVMDGEVVVADGSGNVNVNGTVTADGINLDDGHILGFGTSEDRGGGAFHRDLEIRHDGSNSYIKDWGTGNLAIEATELALRDNSGNRKVFCEDGNDKGVSVHFGNEGVKLATTTDGIDVTGTVTADALTMGDNEKITLGAGGDLEIYSDGATSFIAQPSGATGSDNLVIKGQNVLIKNDAGQELIGTFSDVARLSNQGNVKLVTQTTGVQITGDLKLIDSSDNVTTITESASGNITLTLPSATGTLALENTIVAHTQSTDGTTIGHATVAGYVGKTVVYTNTGDGDDLTLGLPDVGVDIAIGQQIHLVNASNGSGSSALIILDLSESGTGQTVNICTGATVLSNTGSADPHIVAGGVATLVATADNTYVLFGSGVVDN